jgi:nucleoside-diphosphate-sugar epimerase
MGSGYVQQLPAGIDAIAHLAQSRVYRRFPTDAVEMMAVNVGGAFEVLSAAAAAGVERFCLVSSGSVYEPFHGPLAENVRCAPASFLGASKLAAEMIARPFGELFALSVLRLSTPFGPGQTDRLVPELVRRVMTGEPVTLPLQGDGMTFCPTYVDDIADVIFRALDDRWVGTFNVACPKVHSIASAAQTIGDALGRAPSFERKPIAAPVVVPDLTNLGRQYDLRRFRLFADGVREMVRSGG